MKKKVVLIVDDNEFFIQQQIGFLGKNRYDFKTARSGSEALDMARSENPELILLDQFMEDMTGPEICRILKADSETSHIPIVIVSSGEREFARVLSERSGCDGIIFKPVRRDQLIAVVEELLGINGREWKRASVEIPCKIEYEGLETKGRIVSLGGGGALVGTDIALMRGDMCRISFDLPITDRKIDIGTAVVVWKNKGNDPENAELGFHFLSIHVSDQEAVDEYVCSLLGF